MSAVPADDVSPAALGPVSAILVAELREEARKHGALVWLDTSADYSGLVDALAEGVAEFPFPVYRYRHSFLELMLALDGEEDAVAMQPLVVHMPGFNEEDIKQTPLYELYKAGRRYRTKLETVIRNAALGKITPSQIENALQQGLPGLDAADDWLATSLSGEAESTQIKLPVSSPQQLYDELESAGRIAIQIEDPAWTDAILGFLERTLGLDAAWRANTHTTPLARAQDFQLLMSSWALCVEFVNDLKRPPRDAFLLPLRDLPKGLIDASRALAEHLRNSHPETYIRDADQVEAGLIEEVEHATAADLGTVDTLRFEDEKVFAAALQALEEECWPVAADYATGRTKARSFWVRHDRGRRTGWRIIGLAAELGLACSQNESLLKGASNLAQAAERYARHGHTVDSAQRRLEQARGQLHLVQLDEFPALLQCLNQVRTVYRRWADAQAIAFNALCKNSGFLPDNALQQRTLFDDVVRPAVNTGDTVAYFVVDALRYEMGRQLLDWLDNESGARLQIKPRFAELPSLTEVGMNVLAPVVRNARLQPELRDDRIQGFRAGELHVHHPESRRKAMHARVGGETCPKVSLEDLLERDVTSLRRSVSRARLILVHAEGIDKAGEKGVGLRHFEDELQRLRAAWSRLRDAGVRRFVVTADHGFLLQDDTTREPVRHGRKTDPQRRHVIERIAADHDGEVRVSSTELGYDGDELHFMFPETSMPFDTGAKTKGFLHGGNSLQERIIPVITAEYRHDKGGTAVQYRVNASAAAGSAGLHRITGEVTLADNQGFGFGGLDHVELRLVAIDATDITVELMEASGARLEASMLVADVDKPFELQFRLSGPRALRAQIEIRPALGGDVVIPVILERRFAVDVSGEAAGEADAEILQDTDWLQGLPNDQVRSVFVHIQQYGAINEADATKLLGNPRKFRQFSRKFEEYAELAPFELRIDASSGQKRYLREGGSA